MFRFLLLGLFCSLFAWPAASQPHLADARRQSYFIKVFRLNDAQVRHLYQHGLNAAQPDFFTQPVDSFPTNGVPSAHRMPLGYYLVAHADGAGLVYWLRAVADREVALLNNQTDLLLTVRDTLGQLLPEAEVRLHGRRLPYDARTRSYRRRRGRAGLLAITWQGRTTYHALERTFKGKSRVGYALNRTYNRVVWNQPLGYLTGPVYNQARSLGREISHLFRGYDNGGEAPGLLSLLRSPFSEDVRDERENWREQRHEQSNRIWTGFVVCSQPQYRPHGDTLRLKARVLRRRNGRPCRQPLTLTLGSYNGPEKKVTLRPEQPGTYIYTLSIVDSLGWRPDSWVNIKLTNVRGHKYLQSSFKMTDYELPVTRYTLRALTKTQYRGQPQAFFVRGTDFNDLNLLDARVRLAVLPRRVGAVQQPVTFVADTLWTHSQPLDPVGETRIDLPATALPVVGLGYEVVAVFLNADQERHVEQTTVAYAPVVGQLRMQVEKDSLRFDYEENGRACPQLAELEMLGLDTTAAPLFRGLVPLPLVWPLDVRAVLLRLRDAAGHSARLDLSRADAQVQLRWENRADSLFIALDNPRQLPCWYFVYHRNKLVHRGYGINPQLAFAAGQVAVPWQVSLHYQWAGQPHAAEYCLTPDPRTLTVQASQPVAAFPGQRLHLTYTVTDAAGQPVLNADLTAFAHNARFQAPAPPELPLMGRVPASRRVLRRFQLSGLANWPGNPARQLLRWEQWRRPLGLDSLTFYQFLFPASGMFQEYRPAPGSLTQVAPFVVDSGRIETAQAIWLDKKPVYIHEVNEFDPYSLPADSGRHILRIRTATRLVTISNVYLRAGHKLTLSVDARLPQANVQVEKRPARFLTDEASELGRSLVPLSQLDNLQGVLVQRGRIQVLNSYRQPHYWDHRRLYLAGPLQPDSALFVSAQGWERAFMVESGYAYDFAPALIKMSSVSPYQFSHLQRFEVGGADLRAVAFTEQAAYHQLHLQANQTTARLFLDRVYATPAGQGRLEIRLARELDSLQAAAPLSWVLITRPDQPAFERLQSNLTVVHALLPGTYHVALLFADSTLLTTKAAVQVRPNGLTIVQLSLANYRPAGPASHALGQRIARYLLREYQLQYPPAEQRQQLHRQPFGGWNARAGTVRGRVIDKTTNEGLPGVSVIVKNTIVGTATNAEGEFEMQLPVGTTLQFKYLGYLTQEFVVRTSSLDVALDIDSKQLNEVVITALGVVREKRTLGYATSSIAGRAAGINFLPGAASHITVRGNATLSATTEPLLVVDGVPMEGQMADFDRTQIATVQTLSGASALALYGSRGASGVILITTKKASATAKIPDATTATAADPRAALRRHFRDYAWWRPTLLTDARGQASTDVTLPDDLTAWDTFVLASDGHGRAGSAMASLHAYKPLRAELALPRFLVAGDRTRVLGKTLNYLADNALLTTSFAVGVGPARTQTHRVTTATLDTLTVTASATADSLRVTFRLSQATGYQDGEQREVPIVPAGTHEALGTSVALTAADTTLTLPVSPSLGDVQVRIEADALPLLLREIDHVSSYAYLCNEQMASKLLALLLRQRIQEHQKQPFAQGKVVRSLIRRLLDARPATGLWGTWPGAAPSPWVSLHVLEALLAAGQQGHEVKLDLSEIRTHLLSQLDQAFVANQTTAQASIFRAKDDRVRLLRLLHATEAKLDYATYLNRLGREPGRPPLDQLLAQLELRQQLQLPLRLDSLRRYRFTTQLGGVFYADTTRPGGYYNYLLNSRIATTLQAYRLLRATNAPAAELARLRAFLLNQRTAAGHWSSTYESANILATVGPDLLVGSTSGAATTVSLTANGTTRQLAAFPYVSTQPASAGPLTLRKQGPLPVYATAYQTRWNSNPEPVTTAFRVQTSLAGQSGAAVRLRAGQPAELLITLDVKAEARYVLLEVPMPAGCSYGPHAAANPLETHREYLRHQVGIFVDKLPVGRHTFRVALQPRYAGRYTLNPARAELIYFPTRFGRGGSKQVLVAE